MLRAGRVETKEGKAPQYVAIIHCVGSRSQEFHAYCSRVCCMTALKYAHEIKSAVPGCYVSDIYIDMHAFGKGCEDFYRQSSEVKTLFLMYEKNDCPVIRKAGPGDDCEMLIEVNEKLSGETIEIPADLVVLMVGMEAREDSEEVAHLVNISRDKDGWFIESHPKLDPVATTTDGVYIAGACAAPKDIPDRVAQARAAAARILGTIAKGKIEIDARLRRGRRGEVLRLPDVQRALPLRRHRVRRGEEAQPRDQRALQGLRRLRRRLPFRRDHGAPLHRRADLRRRSRGCWHELRAQDRRLPLQLVLLHGRRPGRHQPDPLLRPTCASSG